MKTPRNIAISIPLLSVLLQLVLFSACNLSGKLGLKAPRTEYVIRMDAIDWLLRLAQQPEDSLFKLAIAETKSQQPDADEHPLHAFKAVVEKHHWLDLLTKWFLPASEGTSKDSTDMDQIIHAFDEGTAYAQRVLEWRLSSNGAEASDFRIDDAQQIHFVVTGDTAKQIEERIILPVGQLGFYETFTYAELEPALLQLDSTLTQAGRTWQNGDLGRKLAGYDLLQFPARSQPILQPNYPVVGYVREEDWESVDSMLSSSLARATLPANLRFGRCKDAQDEWPNIFPVIALKTKSDGGPRMDGSCVTKARQDFEPQGVTPMISLEMNREGAVEWQRMTRFNLQKQVAIVMDGLVLTYPTVQGEIAGGRTQITGNFTIEEARDLARLLQAGAYQAKVEILSVTRL